MCFGFYFVDEKDNFVGFGWTRTTQTLSSDTKIGVSLTELCTLKLSRDKRNARLCVQPDARAGEKRLPNHNSGP